MRGLINGLNKTKERLKGSLQSIFSSKSFGTDVVEEVESVLLSADLGVDATDRILERLNELEGMRGRDTGESLKIIAGELLTIIDEIPALELPQGYPRVIVVIGVNGVGKTSTIGKLAHRFKSEGKKVLLAACDTFRAAAIDQLEIWADRAGVAVIKQMMGADPAAVAFDAVQSAIAREMDVVIIDTAGRLHTKKNLMEELGKIFRVLTKRMEQTALEAWLVLDANTGQNSLRQAEAFVGPLPVTGLVLTKLDSTAKGGVVIPIQMKLGIPVLFVGVGEGIDDLEPFDHRLFVEALVGEKTAR